MNIEMNLNMNDKIITCKKDFIYNALEDGWTISKKNEFYVFKKKHENKREVFLDSYLTKFIEKNMKLKS